MVAFRSAPDGVTGTMKMSRDHEGDLGGRADIGQQVVIILLLLALLAPSQAEPIRSGTQTLPRTP